MRTVFKILLAPAWLLLAVLKLAFRLAVGAAAFVLAITEGLLLIYDLFLLIIGLGSKELIPLDDIEKAFENGEETDCGTCSALNDTVPHAKNTGVACVFLRHKKRVESRRRALLIDENG